jgi:hypothetical protein
VVGRFQTMATLQAARAVKLGLPEDSAYSWGLNRAIFYAAAKRGFVGGTGSSEGKRTRENQASKQSEKGEFHLGTEKAFIDEESSKANTPYFTIGGSVQTPKDFERQVIERFGGRENFEKAWEEAMKIVGKYDRATLESQQEFYERVYKPRRDSLSKDWTEKFANKKVIPIKTKI